MVLPAGQLRFTDIDGNRFTCFVTGTRRGRLADLELRHRRRARCEDRIRCAKDTGLRNLPLHGFTQNQIWCELVALAGQLTAWTQMLAFEHHPARRWEPKRLRLRVFSAAARLVKGGRRLHLRLARRWHWADLIAGAITRLQALPAPRQHQPSRQRQEGDDPGPWNPAHPTRQPPCPRPENEGRSGRY